MHAPPRQNMSRTKWSARARRADLVRSPDSMHTTPYRPLRTVRTVMRLQQPQPSLRGPRPDASTWAAVAICAAQQVAALRVATAEHSYASSAWLVTRVCDPQNATPDIDCARSDALARELTCLLVS